MNIAIVGQGLSGTSLWWRFYKRGILADIYDPDHDRSASMISAGILNPVTGRSFVKSWMADTLWPETKNYYQSIEKILGIPIYREIPILRPLRNPKEENNWCAKQDDPECAAYMDIINATSLSGVTTRYLSIGKTKRSAIINVPVYLKKSKDFIIKKGNYIQETFPEERVEEFTEKYDYIIFAHGARARRSALWKTLPIIPSRGDVLRLRSDVLREDALFKDRWMYVPLGNQTFWVGATFVNNYTHNLPDRSGYYRLIEGVQSVLDHEARELRYDIGFRPTVPDRRHLIARHSEHSH